MAKVTLSPVLEGISGAFGNVVFRQYGDKTILSRKPRFESRVFSAAQRDAQERFSQAVLAAKAAMADPQVRSTREQAASVKEKPLSSEKTFTREDAMAMVNLGPMVESIRGTVGDVVFKRYGNKAVLSRKPRFENRVFSAAQRAYQERFRQAMLLAKAAMADPHVRPVYEQAAKAKGKPILSLMVADFLPRTTVLPEISRAQNTGRRDQPAKVVHRTPDRLLFATALWRPVNSPAFRGRAGMSGSRAARAGQTMRVPVPISPGDRVDRRLHIVM